MIAYARAQVYAGNERLDDHTILVENGRIAALLPPGAPYNASKTVDLSGWSVCPGMIDLQVYGGGGALFSSAPTLETLENLRAHCRRNGTSGFFATLPTAPEALMEQAIEAGRAFMEKYPDELFGVHFEGPFLNPVKRGAHPEALILRPDKERWAYWLQRGAGVVKICTVAPEFFDREAFDLAAAHGVILSAGHSDASYEQATSAFQQGIGLATHLFNAMSQFGSRQPGLVGAVFDHPNARASIIADGVHVDFASVRIAKKVMGDRLLLITDAVDDSGVGAYGFFKKDNYYVNADGTLSGSALTMPLAVQNCVQHGICDLQEAIRMATLYPAQVLGIDQTRGRIAAGFAADFCIFKTDAQGVWTLYDQAL